MSAISAWLAVGGAAFVIALSIFTMNVGPLRPSRTTLAEVNREPLSAWVPSIST
jgi:hypothetical protein